jgi:diguanylate cyclase (GGDEF)-like protein
LLAPEHVFGRLGANEFAVLCGGRSIAEITTLARGLLEVGQALQLYATTDPVPSLSVGIAHFMPTDSSLEDIMRRADQALYAAKRQAGHRAVVADGTGEHGLA